MSPHGDSHRSGERTATDAARARPARPPALAHRHDGLRPAARRRPGDPVPEPHLVPRLGVPDAHAAAQHQLRRQGRVHGLVEDEVRLPGHGHDPDRSLGRREVAVARSSAAAEVLRRGELFGIFPEGTRSRDGRLYKGRTGAARLALEVGCPIFPVGIVGTDAIQPPGAKAPKPFRSLLDHDRPSGPARALPRAARAAPGVALDDRRGDVRDPRDDRPGRTATTTPASRPTRRPSRVVARPATGHRPGAREPARARARRRRRLSRVLSCPIGPFGPIATDGS